MTQQQQWTAVTAVLAYCLIVGGVWALACIGWAMVTAGVLLLATSILLYDPKAKR